MLFYSNRSIYKGKNFKTIFIKRIFILISFCLIFSYSLQGQSKVKIKGNIVSSVTNNPIPYVTVAVNQLGIGTITDDNGFFKLSLPVGKHRLHVSCVGYQTKEEIIDIKYGEHYNLKISLVQEDVALPEVVVVGKGTAQTLREKPLSVAVLDSKTLEGRTISINEAIGMTAGVKVLTQGGIGSSNRVIVQGMDGERVNIFMDGILLGGSNDVILESIPIDLIDRVEVYKGVVPANLGGDGLSGAINIITKEFIKDNLQLSYELGSYNSHKGNFVGVKTFPEKGISFTLSGQLNSAKNNYSFKSPFEDDLIIVRDHDRYRSGSVMAGVNFSKLWFDNLGLNFGFNTIYNEMQGGLMHLQQNVQHAFVRTKSFSMGQTFAKQFLNKKLSTSLNSNINYGIVNSVDTSHYCYNFLGDKYPSPSGQGEIGFGANDSHDKLIDVREQFRAVWSPVEKHNFTLNAIYRFAKRTPEDELADTFSNFKRSGYPSQLSALVLGFSYRYNILDDKLINELSGKWFGLQTKIYPAAGIFLLSPPEKEVNNSSVFGYGNSIAWKPSRDFTVKMSFNKTVRIPTTQEFFGDGITIMPSLRLKPEHSYNINLGTNWLINNEGYPNAMIDINAYSMFVKDMIRLIAPTLLFVYANVDKVKIFGIDGEVKTELFPWLSLNLNASYQDARNNAKELLGGGPNSFYGWRVPNMPYFFGNGIIDFHKQDIFKCKGLTGSLFYEVAFTEKYSYDWETSQSNTLIVPRRWTMNTGVHLNFNQSYFMSFEVHNLANREQMAEFNYPLPGRTFHVKLKYIMQ